MIHRPVGEISPAKLTRVMPGLPPGRAKQLSGPLNDAMRGARINTPARQAAFLAQVAVESRGLSHFEEQWDGGTNFNLGVKDREPYTARSKEDYFNYWYGNRPDLGNSQRGDGFRYRGRGPLQLTGRDNYTRASRDLGIDLVRNPDLAADPRIGMQVAGWYWRTRGLNELADRGDFRELTRRINKDLRKYSERQAVYRQALQTFIQN
jgi:predicted chitinase